MINSVRNTVLAIINKNNYGYISPGDFNLFAKSSCWLHLKASALNQTLANWALADDTWPSWMQWLHIIAWWLLEAVLGLVLAKSWGSDTGSDRWCGFIPSFPTRFHPSGFSHPVIHSQNRCGWNPEPSRVIGLAAESRCSSLLWKSWTVGD